MAVLDPGLQATVGLAPRLGAMVVLDAGLEATAGLALGLGAMPSGRLAPGRRVMVGNRRTATVGLAPGLGVMVGGVRLCWD